MDFAELSALAERRFHARLPAFRRALEVELAGIRERAALHGATSSTATQAELFHRCADEIGIRVRSAWEDYRGALLSAAIRLSKDLAETVSSRVEALAHAVLDESAVRYGQGTDSPPFDLETPFREAMEAVAAEIGLFRARSEADIAVSTNGDLLDGRRDGLTQLLTRAAFDTDLSQEGNEATPIMPATLILGDVDHFKAINDSHGHPAGDAVLREVARRLLTVTGKRGAAYRYGGEEIAILLPNHSAEEGLAVAERARQALEFSPVESIKVTASFGVATCPDHATNEKDWLKRADEALYDAKKLGRNLVRLAGEPAPQQDERRGRVIRKQAEPGALSDEKAEELRMEFFRSGFVLCPADQFELEVEDCTTIGSLGMDIYVACPVCGFHAWLHGPQRQ